MSLEGHRFDDIQTVETNVMNAFEDILKSEYQGCLRKWKDRWEPVPLSNGDYFEVCRGPTMGRNMKVDRILLGETSYTF